MAAGGHYVRSARLQLLDDATRRALKAIEE